MSEPTDREPMSDKRLVDIGMVLEVTERPSLWHELYDEAMRARGELVAVRAELADHLATECADAAAGQNAERAERAEAALADLRERLGETREEHAVRSHAGEAFCATEAGAIRIAGDWNRIRPDGPWCAESRLVGQWRPSDATPRSALERAADEQGGGDA